MAFFNSKKDDDKLFQSKSSTLNKETTKSSLGTSSFRNPLSTTPQTNINRTATSTTDNSAFAKFGANKTASTTAGAGSLFSSTSTQATSAGQTSTFNRPLSSTTQARSSTLGTSTATTAATSSFATRTPQSSTTSASGLSSFANRTVSSVGTTATSTLNTATRPASTFTSTLNTNRAQTTTAPSSFSSSFTAKTAVSNDDIAKKLAEAKSVLSNVNKTASTDPAINGALNPNQEVTDVQYRRFAAFIEEKCGIVLGVGKQYLVNSRLSSLLTKFKLLTIDDLINKAMEEVPNNKYQEAVVDAMTTNETLWFRDTYPYLALENIILPELAKKAKYPVRIWSAACSSGQEPYSIAMVIQESLGKMLHVDPKQTQIIGTDLSPEMLSVCRRGQYDAHAMSRGLSAERKSMFFKTTHHNPNIMQVEHRVKSMVEFRPMNLLGSYALMGRFDVIFCRNVLIYFSNEVKAEILRKLTMCLNPGGYLILGSTETLIGVADKYEMMRCNPGIIYRLKPQKYAF